MSLIYPYKPAFSGGEVSPEIWARTDINKYGTSLRTCRNFIVHPTGGVSNRPGTRYVATAKHSDKSVIVQEFVFNDEQKYVFEIGDHYIRFYTEGLPLTVDPATCSEWSTLASYTVDDYVTYGGSTTYLAIQDSTNKQPDTETDYWTEQSVYEIYSPYGEDDLEFLQFESSADVVWITSPDYQTRTLTRYGATDFRLELYEPDDGPFMVENIDESITLTASAVTGSITLSSASAVFDSDHVGALWKLRHYIGGQKDSTAFGSVTTGTAIKCFTTWRVLSHGTWTGEFDVEKSSDGGSTWTVLRSFSGANDYNANTYGTEDIEDNPEPFLVRINFTAYTSGTCNIDLTTDPFYQEGIVRITAFASSTSVTATVLQEIGSTDGTLSWNEGSWSDYRGWPRVARFYQDRLVFAGSDSEPMSIWMTATGNYYSFVRHSTLLDTDGITTNLPSRQLNAINGLVAFKRLLVFTSASIWSIGPVSGSALKPTGFTTEIEDYSGSNGINPLVIGNEAIYAEEHSKIISNIGFSLESDSFAGNMTNILASHLFNNYEILDLAYQRNPDHLIWCLRDDGNLVAMTYVKEQEVVAWHKHDTGFSDDVSGGDNAHGDILSICVVPSDGYDELWLAVSRENGIFIERMVKRLITTECNDGSREVRLEDQFHVDCGVSYGESLIHITGVTLTDPIMITAPAHGFTDGQKVKITHTDESLGLNGNLYIISGVTTNTFTIELFNPVDGWLLDYNYRKEITLDSTKVDDVLSDFPVLVKLDSTNFDFTKCIQTSNYDIRFADGNGNLLSFTRELHDGTGEVAYYWVKIPTVFADTDTVFYMYYGYVDATDASSAANTFSNSYISIHTCDDNAASTVVVDLLGTINGTANTNTNNFDATGQISGALNCNATNYFNMGTGAPYNFTTNSFSFKCLFWTSTSWIAGQAKVLSAKRAWSANPEDGWSIILEASNLCRIHYNYDAADISIANISDSAWHQIRVDFDYTNYQVSLYLDGVYIGTYTTTAQDSQSNAITTYVGRPNVTSFGKFPGIIDHVEFSTGLRGAAWEKADYNSKNNTLVTIADE